MRFTDRDRRKDLPNDVLKKTTQDPTDASFTSKYFNIPERAQ